LRLGYGADIGGKRCDEATALHNAAKNSHEAVAIMLLDRGCDKGAGDRQRRTPLHYAASTDDGSIIKLLLDCGAEKDTDGDGPDDTPLYLAAKQGLETAIKVLLDNRDYKTPVDEINKLDYSCFTALHKAAYLGNTQELRDDGGCTPLQWAVGKDKMDIVKLLK
jgi:hypothetical protein